MSFLGINARLAYLKYSALISGAEIDATRGTPENPLILPRQAIQANSLFLSTSTTKSVAFSIRERPQRPRLRVTGVVLSILTDEFDLAHQSAISPLLRPLARTLILLQRPLNIIRSHT
jgi:hypothetical protein